MKNSGQIMPREGEIVFSCRHPRKRAIQYAAASRPKRWRLWNTGRPVKPGDDNGDELFENE